VGWLVEANVLEKCAFFIFRAEVGDSIQNIIRIITAVKILNLIF
jgi:hypothetical protein